MVDLFDYQYLLVICLYVAYVDIMWVGLGGPALCSRPTNTGAIQSEDYGPRAIQSGRCGLGVIQSGDYGSNMHVCIYFSVWGILGEITKI